MVMRIIVFLLALTGVISTLAERVPFERYQTILNRQMFGAPPPGFDPNKLPSEVEALKKSKELTQEQEKLKSAVHFSVINVRGDGKVEVGFTDNSDPKTPHHYFICEGETAGGWTVESADPDSASMTIVKDGIQLELTLGDNSANGGGNASKLNAASGNGGRMASGTGAAMSLRGLRAKRQQQLNEQLEAQRKERDAERAEVAKREAERDAERAAEREQQQQQLMAIREELKRAREAREKDKEKDVADAAKVSAETAKEEASEETPAEKSEEAKTEAE